MTKGGRQVTLVGPRADKYEKLPGLLLDVYMHQLIFSGLILGRDNSFVL